MDVSSAKFSLHIQIYINMYGKTLLTWFEAHKYYPLSNKHQALIVKADNTVWINQCPVDSVVRYVNCYPLDGFISGGKCYEVFEQLEPGLWTYSWNSNYFYKKLLYNLGGSFLVLQSIAKYNPIGLYLGSEGVVGMNSSVWSIAHSRHLILYDVIIKCLFLWHKTIYDILFNLKVYPPGCLLDNPINAVTTKFVRTSTNKLRCPIFCVAVSKIMFVWGIAVRSAHYKCICFLNTYKQ